ncbi:efflux RND transporter periplasmic adaptor subunit [Noviherbaspirillum soli]|uniref:efflux RND transporter periplasmic adaptor subunit n=1 Tax=Noviherbaspirillum soli TaxID=1064518 RepID=UPI00188BA1D2|nr:efflux RND transporter periplasmic adaptor subunit [Noviherbaspirillum soli]
MKTKKTSMRIAAGMLAALAATYAHGAGPLGCLIEPERIAEVGTPAAGVIRSMLVERGDRVRKGQVIAVLQDDVERASTEVAQTRYRAEAEVRAAQANADLAHQRRDRAQELQARGFISAQALEQTLAETRVAEEKLLQVREQKRSLEKEWQLARARLSERTIRSPFDGVVAERYFSAGERVEEKPMARIAKIDPLRVEVILPAAMYGSVHAGSAARIAADLPGMAPLPARVTLVDRVLDAASGTFRARLLLPNADGRIPAGLRCRAEFDAATGPSPAPAPASATVPSGAPLKLDHGLTLNGAPGRRM